MKSKGLMSILLIVLVFSLIITGCKNDSGKIKELEERISNLQNQLFEKENKIKQLESNATIPETTIPTTTVTETTIAETTVPETIATKTIADEQKLKEKVSQSIEKDFYGKLTRLTVSEKDSTIYISYNSGSGGEEYIKKELFDFTSLFSDNYSNYNIEVETVDINTSIFHSYTSTENMLKIKNYEMSYTDWLKIAFK